MGDDKKLRIDIESFRPDDGGPTLRAHRPTDKPSGGNTPVDIGGGSLINKPGKPKGKPKSGKS